MLVPAEDRSAVNYNLHKAQHQIASKPQSSFDGWTQTGVVHRQSRSCEPDGVRLLATARFLWHIIAVGSSHLGKGAPNHAHSLRGASLFTLQASEGCPLDAGDRCRIVAEKLGVELCEFRLWDLTKNVQRKFGCEIRISWQRCFACGVRPCVNNGLWTVH